MLALILNSGMGTRMGSYTKEHPKCMTDVSATDSILSRQLKALNNLGIKDVVITTGYFDQVLVDYCNSLNLPLNYTFVKNPVYDKTNYIYSIYCAREYLAEEDIVLMHGDLVFEESVQEYDQQTAHRQSQFDQGVLPSQTVHKAQHMTEAGSHRANDQTNQGAQNDPLAQCLGKPQSVSQISV